MTNDPQVHDALVVGAGLSGLMAARELAGAGRRVLVVDKGRSVGGRLATRRIGAGRADHGAQFFTAESPAFRRIVRPWIADGLVRAWSTGWSEGSLTSHRTEALVRHVAEGGMNALAKHLAQGLEVALETRLVRVAPADDLWRAEDTEGRVFQARGLVLTAPVPQTLALFEAGAVELSRGDHYALRRVEYDPALCGLFLFEGDVELPEPGFVERLGADICWIADNQRKGISPDATLVTVQAGPRASEARFAEPDDEVLDTMEAAVRVFCARNAEVKERQLKRWRYASPAVFHKERVLALEGLPPAVCAGDAFGGARVEGAVLSGIEAAHQLGALLAK